MLKDMLHIVKQYKHVYFLIGFASRAQYKSLSAVANQLIRKGSITAETLIVYGGDDARNPQERTLGHLVALVKQRTGCKILATVCDRDDYEPFIDYVIRVKPQYDNNKMMLYTGYEHDEKTKTLTRKGNTRYYLHPTIVPYISHVYICGGGGFGLEDVKYVIYHTNLEYTYIVSHARYKRANGDTLGPIYKYLNDMRFMQ